MKPVHAMCVLVFGITAAASIQAAPGWPLGYEDESTNRFAHDDRTPALIEEAVPRELSGDVLRGLGGPPDPVYVTDDRYFSASACVARMCGMKAFFWLDTETADALGAVVVKSSRGDSIRLGSKSVNADGIPPGARTALLRWLREQDVRPEKAEFVDAGNRVTELIASDFRPEVGFVPDENGPSFDCNRATTRIEQTLCANEELSRLDLELTARYDKIRRGHSRLPARRELLEFQRDWLRLRDRECADSADVVGCLRKSYRTQSDALGEWVPEK